MIEVFFDISSPWTYYPFHRLRQVESAVHDWISRKLIVGGDFSSEELLKRWIVEPAHDEELRLSLASGGQSVRILRAERFFGIKGG